jgi:hypothetical protein
MAQPLKPERETWHAGTASAETVAASIHLTTLEWVSVAGFLGRCRDREPGKEGGG